MPRRGPPPEVRRKDRRVGEKTPLASSLPCWKQPRDLPCLTPQPRPDLPPSLSAPLQTGPRTWSQALRTRTGTRSPARAPRQQHFPFSVLLVCPPG